MIPPWKVVANLSTSAVTGRYVGCRGGATSRNALANSSEAAALCSGMPEKWFYAALAKWGGLSVAKSILVTLLALEVQKMAASAGWRKQSPHIFETLAQIAVDEFLMPARPDGLPGRIKEQEKAGRMAVTSNAWHRTWKQRYMPVAALLESWLSSADSYIRRRQH